MRSVPWLFDVSRGMLLPTEWYVDAYLSADTQTATLRRGRFTKLESPVIGDIAQNWRVVSRGAYAQVARAGDLLRVSMTDDDIDRPFRVEGRFSDEELVEIVSFVRSSPRKPSLPPDPDGTIRLELPDEIDGKLPIAKLVRTGRPLVRITLRVVIRQARMCSWSECKTNG